ncbi:uncharacterized protein BJX67DRAFT_363284 [Aspergillus lucknowensis]|uniref:Uncharacterized protein n=1 Tax=Aspergillus lucknowensis TaxID=176173 RepID=A0ABR4LGR1_9EURO
MPDPPHRFTAPGLNNYPIRRDRKINYVYGASNTHTRGAGAAALDSSRNNSPDDNGTTSYEEQRYPNAWYSKSGAGEPEPESEFESDSFSRPLHRTHRPRRSIIKPPTQTDDEMLLRNTWSIIAHQEEQINYMHEFLSSFLMVGEDVLDSMWETSEIGMREDATRRANATRARMSQSSREPPREPSPMPRQFHEQYLPQHQDQGLDSYPETPDEWELPRGRTRTRREFSPTQSQQYRPQPSSPLHEPAGPDLDLDLRPEREYGREGAMSRQEGEGAFRGFSRVESIIEVSDEE